MAVQAAERDGTVSVLEILREPGGNPTRGRHLFVCVTAAMVVILSARFMSVVVNADCGVQRSPRRKASASSFIRRGR